LKDLDHAIIVKLNGRETDTLVTEAQIREAGEKIRAELVKLSLPSWYIEKLITINAKKVAQSLDEVFQGCVGMFNEVIVRKVKVDRNRTSEQVLAATGKRVTIAGNMPNGAGEEVDVFFFPITKSPDKYTIYWGLKLHGLKADPYAVAQVNIDDPEFATTHPNGTLWERNPNSGSNSDWSHLQVTAEFVEVSISWQRWHGEWWIGGVLA
jgi:hypothetical protein